MKVETVKVGTMLVTNCYIVYEGADCAVIDPGFMPERITAALKRLGLTPEAVLLTHGHRDHTGALRAIKERYGCTLYAGKDDAYRLPVKPDVELAGGESFCVGALQFSVIATPGHTEGGVCYMTGDCLFTGDTLFCGDVGRTDLPGGDRATLMQSLKKLRDISGDYTVYPGHEESTTLSRERENNIYLG